MIAVTVAEGELNVAQAASVKPRFSRTRAFLSALLLTVAAIALSLTVVAAWTRATVLNTDRYVALVERVASDTRVTTVVSDRVSQQIVVVLDVKTRLSNLLPPAAQRLVVPLTERVQTAVASGLNRVLSSDAFLTTWVTANRIAHEQLLAVVRGDAANAHLENGTLTIDLLPIVVDGIRQLQTLGIIPDSVQLPDALADRDFTALRAELATRLGATLPPDFGTIVIADATALDKIQRLVNLMDAAVIGAIVVTVVFTALGLLLARRRLRALAFLALGSIGVLVLLRSVIRATIDDIDTIPANPDAGLALAALLDDLLSDLLLVMGGVALIAAVIALVAGLINLWRSPNRRPLTMPSADTILVLVIEGAAIVLVYVLAGPDLAILTAIVIALWALFQGSRGVPATPPTDAIPVALDPTSPAPAASA